MCKNIMERKEGKGKDKKERKKEKELCRNEEMDVYFDINRN
jgi:hypothetical protein